MGRSDAAGQLAFARWGFAREGIWNTPLNLRTFSRDQ